MAKPLADLTHLNRPGARIALRATPGAAANRITLRGGALIIATTAPAEAGRANAAVQKLLARALGVAKTRLTLVSGATSRDKVFVIDD